MLETAWNHRSYARVKTFRTGVTILISGGCTKLPNLKTKLIELIDQEYNLVVIQDADNSKKDPHKGGYEKRLKYLEEIETELNIAFDSFLFPDNSSDGDLEDLLLSIANEAKFEPFYECYTAYSEGVRRFSCDTHADELLLNKHLVFNYCQVYQGTQLSNESKRCYNCEYWELDSDFTKPLREFLIQILGA